MSLPLTQQQTPWCHLTRYAGVTSVPTVVLPQTWRWHYLRCYLKYGGRLTSGATADTEVASPQVSVQIWRQCHLRCQCRYGGSATSDNASPLPPQALLAQGRRAQTACIRLAPCSLPGTQGRPWSLTDCRGGRRRRRRLEGLGVPSPASPRTLGADTSPRGTGTLQTLPRPRHRP